MATVLGSKQKSVILIATFQLPEELVVSLGSHDDLAVDVLDVHVFTPMASMCSHKTGLIGHTVDVVCNRSMSCLLESRSSVAAHIRSCLLDGVE